MFFLYKVRVKSRKCTKMWWPDNRIHQYMIQIIVWQKMSQSIIALWCSSPNFALISVNKFFKSWICHFKTTCNCCFYFLSNSTTRAPIIDDRVPDLSLKSMDDAVSFKSLIVILSKLESTLNSQYFFVTFLDRFDLDFLLFHFAIMADVGWVSFEQKNY